MALFTRRKPAPPPLMISDRRGAPPARPDDARVIELVHVVADHVVVLHDLGFEQAVVRCARAGGRLRVASTDVRLASTAAPHHYTHDPLVRTALLSAACEALAAELAARGRTWDGAATSIDHLDERLELACKGPDDALGALISVHDLVPSPAFLALVTRATDGVDARQEQVNARIAGKPWSFDKSTSTLVIGETDRIPATLLGSYAIEMQSWLWSWANSTLRALDTTVFRATCERLASDGMRVFGMPGLACDEGFAWSIAIATAAACGFPPVYRVPVGPTQLFFALDL